MKKILPVIAAILAILLLAGRGERTDPGALAEGFYRRLFRGERAREVFGLEEEDVVAVFGEADTEEKAV